MNKHTPTPWAINQYGKVVHVNSNGRDTISTDGFAICGDAESAANTAHIVRCVNSHEALVKALQECLQNTGGGWIAASVIDRARAALAAAGAPQ